MPQVLKNEQRDKILYAAKIEFAQKGITATSLRSIAKNADMTVGNLYRYFKNKEEIAFTILHPILEKLNKITDLMHYDNGINEEDLHDEIYFREVLFKLADCMIDIEASNPLEIKIMIEDDEINRKQNENLHKMIIEILKRTDFEISQNGVKLNMVSLMIATSISSGLREGMKIKQAGKISSEDYRDVLRQYLFRSVFLLKFKK